MFILSKLICRTNAVHIKVPMSYFTGVPAGFINLTQAIGILDKGLSIEIMPPPSGPWASL